VAATRKAKAFAIRLARDFTARVEDARDHRRVDVGHVALEHRSAVHHRHAGDADVVLDRDPLAAQRPARGALDRGLVVPRVQRVLVALGTVARRARVFDRRLRFDEFLQALVGRHGPGHQALEGHEVLRAQVQTELRGDVLDFVERGRFDDDGGYSCRRVGSVGLAGQAARAVPVS